MSTKAVRIIISGKVQGVFFRAHTAKKANEIGITGYVRNLPDGNVEAVGVGTGEQIERFIAFCRKGSPASRVDDITQEELDPDEKYQGFEITG